MPYDVAVVGAGPAGSVLAARMAQLGHRVCLVEAARFPRRRLGESLTPGVLPMLGSIGVPEAALRRGALEPSHVEVCWGGETRRDGAGALLVDRGVFDATLLAFARASGVEVLQPMRLDRARETPGGWLLELRGEAGEVAIDARFLGDASGRSSRLGVRRRATGPRTFAVHGYWRGRSLPTAPRVEATERGWLWGVPIPDGSYDTLAFVDATDVRDIADRGPSAWLASSLGAASFGPWLAEASLEGAARIVDATPYLDRECVGSSFVRVGDAALALDPLSSSGVQKAVQSALSGAIVANTLLTRPERGDLAMGFHREQLRVASERHVAWAAEHHRAAGRDGPFWRARGAGAGTATTPGPAPRLVPTRPLRLSADVHWVELPVLGAELVEAGRALTHPGLDGPIAFLGGRALAPMLEGLTEPWSVASLGQRWRTSPHETLSLVRWLHARGILVQPEA